MSTWVDIPNFGPLRDTSFLINVYVTSLKFHCNPRSFKARQFTEVEILSDYDNMDVILGEGSTNSLERELDNVLKGPESQQDPKSVPNKIFIPRKRNWGYIQWK